MSDYHTFDPQLHQISPLQPQTPLQPHTALHPQTLLPPQGNHLQAVTLCLIVAFLIPFLSLVWAIWSYRN
jgi:hypothetical protein